jgi:hypothetical protein
VPILYVALSTLHTSGWVLIVLTYPRQGPWPRRHATAMHRHWLCRLLAAPGAGAGRGREADLSLTLAIAILLQLLTYTYMQLDIGRPGSTLTLEILLAIEAGRRPLPTLTSHVDARRLGAYVHIAYHRLVCSGVRSFSKIIIRGPGPTGKSYLHEKSFGTAARQAAPARLPGIRKPLLHRYDHTPARRRRVLISFSLIVLWPMAMATFYLCL